MQDNENKRVTNKKKTTTKTNSKDKETKRVSKVVKTEEPKKVSKVAKEPKKVSKEIKPKTTKSKQVEISKVEEEIITKINKLESKNKIANNNEVKNVVESFSLFEVILIIIITILSCLLVFSFIRQSDIGNSENKDIADIEYTKDDIELFLRQYNYILNNYYGEIDKEELLKSAVDGMLSSLDEYSKFIDEESNSFSITLEGEYEGIGISIYNDYSGNIIIQQVYDNTPASKAGLKPNDVIKKFNDVDLFNVSTTDLVDMIAQADEMNLTILRDEKEVTVVLKREKIILNSVNYKMLDNKIGYIDIDIFANNTPEQFKTALTNLENKKMKSLIIDLRDNTGGHLSSVEEMLYSFLDSQNIIYQTEDKTGVEKVYSKGSKNKKYDIVILQNGSSASASEIMSAALKENLDAYIIGTKSFGKGTVQTLISMNSDLQYKVTTKRWLTPKGNWIDGIGISPDLEVILSDEYYLDPTIENDNQLNAAIDYLNK